MADEFPKIEPSTFDMIVVGTGLKESILAAAASNAGHKVLHLDPCPFYGLHWTSLSLDEITQWATSGGRLNLPKPSPQIDSPEILPKSPHGEDLELEPITERPLYSDFDLKTYSSEPLGPSRSFNLDLSGPKLAFCRGPLVDLLLKAGASNYLEFKSVEGCYIWSGFEQGLMPVPDSRASIFQDRTLSLAEKRYLMRFFKLVQNNGELSEEVLETKFVDFLDQQRLPSSIKSMILYAIALADHDQEDEYQGPSTILKTKDGIESLVLYLSSIGRFVNSSGAFLYPVYGQAELPQAFCRTAAVKGTLYVLRMPVIGLLIGKESRIYKGIQTASGQYLFSHKLVVNSSITLPFGLSPSLDKLRLKDTESEDIQSQELSNASMVLTKDHVARMEQMRHPLNHYPCKQSWKVARSICITNQSLKLHLSTVLMVFPPRSMFSKQRTAIRALQLSSNTSVCPKGMYVVYFSTLCSDTAQGKEALIAVINSLFVLPDALSSESETASVLNNSESEGRKPTLLWSTFFVQHLTEDLEHSSSTVAECCMPDETLDYGALVMSTTKMFEDLYQEEELFAQPVVSEETVENGDDFSGDAFFN